MGIGSVQVDSVLTCVFAVNQDPSLKRRGELALRGSLSQWANGHLMQRIGVRPTMPRPKRDASAASLLSSTSEPTVMGGCSPPFGPCRRRPSRLPG